MRSTPQRRPPDPGRVAVTTHWGRERSVQAGLDVPLSASPQPAGAAPPTAVLAADAAVRLGGRTIWQGVSFAISPGTFTAILGPNGIGKPTFLKATLGLQLLAGG